MVGFKRIFCMSLQNKLVLVGLYKRQNKVIFFETTTLTHDPKYVKSFMSQLYQNLFKKYWS